MTTRRAFFATLFAPLLARWMPKPKPSGETFYFIGRDKMWALYGDRPPVPLEPWGPSRVHLIMKSRQLGMTQMIMEHRALTEEWLKDSPYWHGRAPFVIVDIPRKWPWDSKDEVA